VINILQLEDASMKSDARLKQMQTNFERKYYAPLLRVAAAMMVARNPHLVDPKLKQEIEQYTGRKYASNVQAP
jgi:hypothetical protein